MKNFIFTKFISFLEPFGNVIFNFQYNKNFKAFVNNKEVPIEKTDISLMKLQIPVGKNDIKIVYENKLFKIACVIGVFFLIIGPVIIFIYANRKKLNV